jgi:hypothetical protein
MAFVGMIQQLIDHGFTFPRIHPDLDIEELQPSFEHPNEYITADELAAAKAYEIEEEQRWEDIMREPQEKNAANQVPRNEGSPLATGD